MLTPRRPWTAVAVATAAALVLGPMGAAYADGTASPTPDPVASTPAPTPTSPTPAPTRPVTLPPATPTAPQQPVVPALPPNDGVAPDPGVVDQFLALTAERDPAARALDAATSAYDQAHARLVQTQQQLALLRLARAQLQGQADVARATTDAVVNQLYQSGDSGLGSMIRIFVVGPDGFMMAVDNAFKARRASNEIVYRGLKAQADVAFARQVETQVRATVATQTAADRAASSALSRARNALSDIDSQLGALATAAPSLPLDADGCPRTTLSNTLRDGSESIGAEKLCRDAVAKAASPQAALAITWAFRHLGAAYACGGAGRMLPYRADCSSFVSRAYHEGAGLGTASTYDAPSTRDMVPWGGASLDPHYAYVAPSALLPGDLVLYDTCPASGSCAYRHVVMYLGEVGGHAWMVHTSACGDVAHVSAFWGTGGGGHAPFLVARRVLALGGEPSHAAPPSWIKAHPTSVAH